jgi:putative transposase
MRNARIKAEGGGYYHGMSRIIERRRILGEAEKERLLKLMQGLAAFGGLEILTYAFLSNHVHVLAYVPERRPLCDEEFLQRLGHILEAFEVEQIRLQLQDARQQGQDQVAESLKARFTYRMFDLSEFFKALKQRFSQSYNRRAGRCGPLWEQRFKSILVEGSERALLTLAAYIDLNAVRAGLVADPKDYRYSGYGAALGGASQARAGLRRLMEHVGGGQRVSWGRAQRAYRQQLYVQGQQKGLSPEGQPIRQGFTPAQVDEVLQAGGRLPLHEVLRCRVRYFTDGLALGRPSFLERVFQRHRQQFGPNRQHGARPMRFGEWGGLCTLRDLRLQPVTRACP